MNRDPSTRRWIHETLTAGEALGYFITRDDGTGRDLSHIVERSRARFHVFGADDEHLGSFATSAKAEAVGFAASLKRLGHGMT